MMRRNSNRHILYWFRCPDGHLGRIDQEQADAKVSIVCDQCHFHGLVGQGSCWKCGHGSERHFNQAGDNPICQGCVVDGRITQMKHDYMLTNQHVAKVDSR